mmetsp:Transcript_34089/g.98105  ORF Transcript_34089/g.98105 Transcript_34089/m.98105 type:complete len:222 (+) Transcript_34089:143-808(+)
MRSTSSFDNDWSSWSSAPTSSINHLSSSSSSSSTRSFADILLRAFLRLSILCKASLSSSSLRLSFFTSPFQLAFAAFLVEILTPVTALSFGFLCRTLVLRCWLSGLHSSSTSSVLAPSMKFTAHSAATSKADPSIKIEAADMTSLPLALRNEGQKGRWDRRVRSMLRQASLFGRTSARRGMLSPSNARAQALTHLLIGPSLYPPSSARTTWGQMPCSMRVI